MTRRGDRGSITPLIVGFTIILATLVAVAVDASAAFLRRQQLDAVADAAALAATDAARGNAIYTQGLRSRLVLDPAVATRAAAASIAASGARQRYPGLTLAVRTTADRVIVVVRTPLRLPLAVPGVGDSTVTGTAAAVVTVTP